MAVVRQLAAPIDQPVQGLRANLLQFMLLVLVNAFVGGMVGMERSVIPLLGRDVFHVASATLVMSFIATFGLTKAFTNLAGARLSESIGRRGLLIAGWIAGSIVPFILLWAPAWQWVVFANVLLGINQGLCWSMTVIMKIDLVGSSRRGLAMGLNEFAGYVSLAVVAFATAVLAERYGLRPLPLVLGAAIAMSGFLISVLFVRETRAFALGETASLDDDVPGIPFRAVLARTTFTDPTLSACSQAGLVNNLNDGMVWGLLPLMATASGFSLLQLGVLTGAYPLVWGLLQAFTGALSDAVGRKRLIASGMVVQAAAIGLFLVHGAFGWWLVAAIALGIGTAMVYPTLLAAVGDIARPSWRASAVGVYRMWRDAGYVVGALGAGAIADFVSLDAAVAAVALVTLASGVIVAARMKESLGSSERLALTTKMQIGGATRRG